MGQKKLEVFKRNVAFTLAEALITLSIIGVIASLVIPIMARIQQEKETIVALKKYYSVLSEAYISAVKDNGTPDNWGITGLGSGTSAVTVASVFTPYLNISKNCANVANTGCFPGSIKSLSGATRTSPETRTDNARIILNDGALMSFYTYHPSCAASRGPTLELSSICADVLVDTNGFDSPNQYGKDLYSFYITKYGILPYGTNEETTFTFSSYCADKSTAEGWSCAAWVLYNNNMDYLYCSDLVWGGKNKCS